MSMHPDLEWLASHVSEWPEGFASCDVVADKSVLPYGRHVEYKKEGGKWSLFDWQLARDAWLESMMTPEEEQDYAPEPDMVNQPPHYQLHEGYEVYDLRQDLARKAQAAGVPHDQFSDWDRALEYLLRMWEKNGVEDAKKGAWYVNKLIGKLEASALRAGELGE